MIRVDGTRKATQADREKLAEAIRQVLISQTREGTQGPQHDSTEHTQNPDAGYPLPKPDQRSEKP